MNTETLSIAEGNKLIIFFDGAEETEIEIMGKPAKAIKWEDSYYPPEVMPPFNKDWNLLMPLLRKIKNYLNDIAERPSRNHCCEGDLIEVDIQCALWELDIKETWKHIVQFIQWYNNQKSKP